MKKSKNNQLIAQLYEAISFDKWFKTQFGRLPMADHKYHDICLKKQGHNFPIKELEQKLEEEEILRSKYTAALYTYQMKG